MDIGQKIVQLLGEGHFMKRRRWFHIIFAAVTLLTLAGCGTASQSAAATKSSSTVKQVTLAKYHAPKVTISYGGRVVKNQGTIMRQAGSKFTVNATDFPKGYVATVLLDGMNAGQFGPDENEWSFTDELNNQSRLVRPGAHRLTLNIYPKNSGTPVATIYQTFTTDK